MASLGSMLGDLQLQNYQSGLPLSENDIELVRSSGMSYSTLLAKLQSGPDDERLVCLALEALSLTEDQAMEICMLVSKRLEPAAIEYNWDTPLREDIESIIIFRLRLLVKYAQVFNTIGDWQRGDFLESVVYLHEGTLPWSSDSVAQFCNQILAQFEQRDVASTVVQRTGPKASELTKLNRGTNHTLRKRREFMMKNLQMNTGFFKTSSIELNNWRRENLKLLANLKFLIQYGEQDIALISSLLLNFLEDHDVSVMTYSCQLLYQMLTEYPPSITLSNYNKIFQESLDKCLLLLPPLTPIPSSCRLLKIAYKCYLYILREQRESIVTLLQDSVIPGMLQVQDKSFEVLSVLLEVTTQEIIPQAETYITLALPQLVPQLLNVLTDPYVSSATKIPSLVIAALMRICEYAWPVVEKYRYDLLGAMAMAADRLDRSAEDQELLQMLRDLSTVLSACCKGFDQDLKSIAPVLMPADRSLFM